MQIRALALVVLSFAIGTAGAQTTRTAPALRSVLTMDRFEGTSVITNLSDNVTLNNGSTLRREWFVIRDDASPVQIVGSAGVNVIYKSERSSGQYQYRIPYQLKSKESVTAVEVRMHVLDVFGRLLKTLSSTEVTDFSDIKGFEGIWRIWSENEASGAFASVAYVAQVRTASGRVYEADRTAVFEQVRKVAKRISEADLEPEKETPVK